MHALRSFANTLGLKNGGFLQKKQQNTALQNFFSALTSVIIEMKSSKQECSTYFSHKLD